MNNVMRNAFEALCERAVEKGWCWNIYCGTCGHSTFKCGLKELARGRHPDSGNWRMKSYMEMDGNFLSECINELQESRTWVIEEQDALLTILSGASLHRIALNAESMWRTKDPSWLGYLGLGLVYTEDAEKVRRELTKIWIPQLMGLLPSNSQSIKHLRNILDDSGNVLGWTDLSTVYEGLREKV